VRPVTRWHEGLADAVVEVDCGGERHRVRWHRGRLQLEGHPDAAAEDVLHALAGGPGASGRPACLGLRDLWRLAVADGGFLTEWAGREDADPDRRGRHQVALVRLRREGVQDLLPDLDHRRAERMGTVLAEFPPELVDRAALAAAQRLVRRGDLAGHELGPWLARAVSVRARSAFVRSLAAWPHRARPAALVPFRCRVGIAVSPQVAGVLGGRASWCEVVLDGGWLLDVWGRGLAVVDGQLVVAAEPAQPARAGGRDRWSVLTVVWDSEARGQPLTPRLVRRTAAAHTAMRSRTLASSSAPVSPLSTTRPASSTA
jgi:hypothetical protein